MKANRVKAKSFKFLITVEQHKTQVHATGTVAEGATGVTIPRCATTLHSPGPDSANIYTSYQLSRKWLYKSAEQNYFRVHKSYSCVHGHWMRDLVKTWQLLWITYKRQPADGNKYVCFKTMTLQWITFLEIKDQHKSLNSLLKILYFFFLNH